MAVRLSFISTYLVFIYIINKLEATPILHKQSRESNIIESRLSLSDYEHYNDIEPQGPGTYAFGYDIEDPETDNTQFRNEERHPNGTVTGSYGYVMPDGNVHIVNYIADHLGYRATVETRKRGHLKPINVNVDEGIAEALGEVDDQYLTHRKAYQNGNLDQHVRPLDQQYNNLSPFTQNNNYKINNQALNLKDRSYSISNNIAKATQNAAARILPNNVKSERGQYRFYYVPINQYKK